MMRITEIAFVPKKVADRPREYVIRREIRPDQEIYRISYMRANQIVKTAGKVVNATITPHDLRRYSATYAPPGRRTH